MSSFFQPLFCVPTIVLHVVLHVVFHVVSLSTGVRRRADVAPEGAARRATCRQRGARKGRRRRRFHTPRWKGGYGRVAGTVYGKVYGMGRDGAWDRTRLCTGWDGTIYGTEIRGITGRNEAGRDGMGPLAGASSWCHSRLARGRYEPCRYVEHYEMVRYVISFRTGRLSGLLRVS